MGLTHPPRQLCSGIRPHAVGPEPVIPRAYRLMRTEVGRERSPGAACMLQVETAVHHLAHIGGQSKVVLEQGFDDIPFRVRQVARIASPISLVFLTVLVCPHPNLLLAAFNSRQGESVKQALREPPWSQTEENSSLFKGAPGNERFAGRSKDHAVSWRYPARAVQR